MRVAKKMFEWFAAGVSSAKTALEITKGLMTLRDAEMVRAKVFDLTSALTDLQQQLMTAQTEQMDLVQRLQAVQKDLELAQQQNGLRDQYSLHQFGTGNFAYRLNPEFQSEQPEHYLCSNCFEQGNRVTLQRHYTMYSIGLKCPRCEKYISTEVKPKKATNTGNPRSGIW